MYDFKEQLNNIKWQENLKRMNNAAKYIDFYNNDYDVYIKNRISKEWVTQAESLKKIIRKYPLTERLIQDMSLVFKQGFQLKYNGSEQQTTLLNNILNQSNLKSYMILVNKLVNLVYDVGIIPRYYNGKIIYDILTPDKCWVKQVENYPTQIEQLYYWIDQPTNTNTTYTTYNTGVKITNNTISKVQIDIYGKITKQYEVQPNPYGYIPVIFFNENVKYNTFWSQKVNPIIQMHEYYCLSKTFETLAIAYQSYATMITIGMPQNQQIPFGPQFWINIPKGNTGINQNVDAKFITPDANFQALYAYSNQLLEQAAIYAGLSADAYKRNASYNSGYQLAISKNQLFDYNRLQMPMFNMQLTKLVNTVIDTWNIYDPNSSINNNNISIYIPQLSVLQSNEELNKQYDWELQHNIINIIDIMKVKYPQMQQNELQQLLLKNKELNNNTDTIQNTQTVAQQPIVEDNE